MLVYSCALWQNRNRILNESEESGHSKSVKKQQPLLNKKTGCCPPLLPFLAFCGLLELALEAMDGLVGCELA